MKDLELNEQEATLIREQFNDFLTGRSHDENVMLSASDLTMHVDDHNDNHTDFAS
jgi:hypothetical protein